MIITEEKIKNWPYLAVLCVMSALCVFLGRGCYDAKKELNERIKEMERGVSLGPTDDFIRERNARYDVEIDSLSREASYWKEQSALLQERIIKSEKSTKRNDQKLRDDIARWRELPNDERAEYIRDELSKVDTLPGW